MNAIGERVAIGPSKNKPVPDAITGRVGTVVSLPHTICTLSGKEYEGVLVDVDGYRDRVNPQGLCGIPLYRLTRKNMTVPAADHTPYLVRDVMLSMEMDGVEVVNNRHLLGRSTNKRWWEFWK